MRRAILSALLVSAAIVLQLTVVNRLTLPGGGEPDLVLLVVVALGLCGGPVTGALTGFAAGLCLDLAPPASALIGEYALVFCVIGFCCGKLRGVLSQSALLALGTAAAAAAVGEALYAAIGLALDRAQVTVASVRQLLPSSVGYDVALTPVVLFAVMQAVRLAADLGPGAQAPRADGTALLSRAAANGLVRRPGATVPAGAIAPGGTGLLGGAGLLGGTGWLSGPHGSRSERRAASRRGASVRRSAARPGDGWIGSGPSSWRRPAAQARRGGRAPARLRPGAGVAGTAARSQSGLARPARMPPARPIDLRLAASRRQAEKARRAARPARGGAPRGTFAGGGRAARPAGWAGRPGAAAARPGGGPSRGHGFRPRPGLSGGSAATAGRTRTLTARPVSLRLRAPRRRDGVVGGGMLSRAGAGGTTGLSGISRLGTRRPAAPRFHLRSQPYPRPQAAQARFTGTGLDQRAMRVMRGPAARRGRLRLGRSRRGDGVLGGTLGWRGRPALRPRKSARFRTGRSPVRLRLPWRGAVGQPAVRLGGKVRLGGRVRMGGKVRMGGRARNGVLR